MSSSRAEALRRKDMKIADKYKETCPPNRIKDLEPLVKQLKGNEKEIQKVIQEWWEDPGSVAREPEWENVSKKTPKPHTASSYSPRPRHTHSHSGRGGRGVAGRGYNNRGGGGGGDNINSANRRTNRGERRRTPRNTTTPSTGSNTEDTAPPPVANVIIDPKPAAAAAAAQSSMATSDNELPMTQKEDMIIPNTPLAAVAASTTASSTTAATATTAATSNGGGNVWATKGSAHIIHQQHTQELKKMLPVPAPAPVGSKKMGPTNGDVPLSTTDEFTISAAPPVQNVQEPVVSSVEEEEAAATALDMVENLTEPLAAKLDDPSPWANSVSVEELVQEAAKATLEDPIVAVEADVVVVEQPPVVADVVVEKPVLKLGRWGEAAANTAANTDNFDFVFGTEGVETEAADPAPASAETAAPTTATSPQAQASPARPPPGLSLSMPPMPPGVVHVHELENKLESSNVVVVVPEEPSKSEVTSTKEAATKTEPAVPSDVNATTKLAGVTTATQPPSAAGTTTNATQSAATQPAFPPYGQMGMGYPPIPFPYNVAHTSTEGGAAGSGTDLPPGLPHAQPGPPPYGNMNQQPHPAMYYQGMPYGYGYQFGAPGYGGYGANPNPYQAPTQHDMSGVQTGPDTSNTQNQHRGHQQHSNRGGYRGKNNNHYQNNQHQQPQYSQYNPQMMGYGQHQHAQPPYNAGYGGYGPDMGYGMQQAGYGGAAQPDHAEYNGGAKSSNSKYNRGSNGGKYGQGQQGGVNQHLNGNSNGFPQGGASALQEAAPQQGGWSGAANSGLNNHQWGAQGGWQHQG